MIKSHHVQQSQPKHEKMTCHNAPQICGREMKGLEPGLVLIACNTTCKSFNAAAQNVSFAFPAAPLAWTPVSLACTRPKNDLQQQPSRRVAPFCLTTNLPSAAIPATAPMFSDRVNLCTMSGSGAASTSYSDLWHAVPEGQPLDTN